MGTELNANLTFDLATATQPDLRRAFLGHKAETKERLLPGSKLYKWTQHPLVGPKGITPWWSFLEDRTLANGSRVEGLAKLQEYAQRLSATDSRYHRTRLAVTKQWNQMNRPLVIQLLKPVWGFAGKASGQLEDQTVSNVYLIGGAYQIWIPNLTLAHLQQVHFP